MSDKSNASLKKDLHNLIAKFYPQVKFHIIFSNQFSIASFFKYKDRVPNQLRSDIVYQYKCPECPRTYVGESARHLYTRVAEHRGVSPRTGLPVSNPKSNIYQHFLDTGHVVSPTAFEVLFSNPGYNLKLIESIFIHKNKPDLNEKLYSTPLHILD